MARQKNNVVTHGLSGKIGDLLVFRQRGGKTIVAKIQQQPYKRSEQQKEQSRKFQQAVRYAKAAMADPDKRAAYNEAAATGQTGYNMAIADFFHAPEIENIDLSGYTGQPGNRIIIRATDDFLVKEVKITITDAAGALLEEGDVIPDSIGYVWTYTATTAISNLNDCKIEIAASDLPGNVTRETRNIQQ